MVVALVTVMLGAAVLAAVHHAEVVAHRVGEPFGSLVLAVAVTVIEVALIVTLMISGGPETASLARDTVFAAVMITCNGIVGLPCCSGRSGSTIPRFNAEGTGAALATVATLATLTPGAADLHHEPAGAGVLPAQLAFAAVASLVLYGLFVAHPDRPAPRLLPAGDLRGRGGREPRSTPTRRPRATALVSLACCWWRWSPWSAWPRSSRRPSRPGVAAVGFPHSFVGVVIALLVLLPETLAAARAARRDRVQTSLNLAFGSAMASIGLTIPAIAVASIWLDGPLLLGLEPTQMVLLALTVVVGILTVVPGRATRLQGGVHLVLLAAFLFLAINP